MTTTQEAPDQQAVPGAGPVVYGASPPLWTQPAPGDPAICYTAQDYRLMLSMMYPAPGVMKAGDFAVTATGPVSNTVNVAAGNAVVPGNTVSGQGNYFVHNPATINIQPPTPPTVNQRYDLIILGVEDGQITGTHQYRWFVQVISGAEAAAPVVPNLPKEAIALATILRKVGTVNIAAADINSRAERANDGGPAAYAPGNNLNNIVASGVYRCSMTPATLNGPDAECIVYVGFSDSGAQTQMAIELVSDGPRQWHRAKWGSTWSPWSQGPSGPQGVKGSSSASCAANAFIGMAVAPAMAGITSLAGDKYTVLADGVFTVTLSSEVSGSYSHQLRITAGGSIYHDAAHASYDSKYRGTISWSGYLKAGETMQCQLRNAATSTRTFTRTCSMTFAGG